MASARLASIYLRTSLTDGRIHSLPHSRQMLYHRFAVICGLLALFHIRHHCQAIKLAGETQPP